MGDFSITFTDTNVTIPPGLGITVGSYSWDDHGGPAGAEVALTGSDDALWAAAVGWLGKEIRIDNDFGSPVWWGVVSDIKISLGSFVVGVSLDNMANRIKVMWTQPDATGASESLATAWTDDTASQTAFGIKELIDSIGDSSTSIATARRNTLLGALAWPVGVPSFTGGSAGATVTCIGFFQTLGWRYYSNPVGRVENIGTGSGTISVGWRLTASSIGFINEHIHHVGAKLHALRSGDKVAVTGSASNNVVMTMAGSTTDAQVIVSATSISFVAADEVRDAGGYFYAIRALTYLLVAGSAGNSGYHYAKEWRDAYRFIISPGASRALVDEAAGPSITITEGHSVQVATTTSIVQEGPGASVTLTLYGYEMAQSFVPSVNMTSGQISLKLGKYGSPADNLVISLCADSSLSPGTVLGTATLAGSAIYVGNSTSDYWITLPAIALTAGTRYWFKVNRSGSVDPDNYYVLGVTEDAYDYTKAYTGSTWVSFNYRDGAYSIPFKVWDTEDTSVSMARILTNCGQTWVSSISVAATGVYLNQYVDNDATALVELEKLLNAGKSDGSRLVGSVGLDHRLTVTAQPAVGDYTSPVLHRDGMIADAYGSAWETGRLPVGIWLQYAGVPGDINAAWRISPGYIQSANYDVKRRRVTVVPLAAKTALTLYKSG